MAGGDSRFWLIFIIEEETVQVPDWLCIGDNVGGLILGTSQNSKVGWNIRLPTNPEVSGLAGIHLMCRANVNLPALYLTDYRTTLVCKCYFRSTIFSMPTKYSARDRRQTSSLTLTGLCAISINIFHALKGLSSLYSSLCDVFCADLFLCCI